MLKKGLLGLLVVAVIGAGTVVWKLTHWQFDYSDVEKPSLQANGNPELIARGEYLFHAVAHCSACHVSKEIGRARKRGDRSPPSGGSEFDIGPFGFFVAPNITSDPETGIGSRADDEIARAIRSGVSHDGKYLPLMALSLGDLADADLAALLTYIRTIPPVKAAHPPDRWGWLGKLFASSFKPRVNPLPEWVPAGGISVARGAYLANGPAMCTGCHTRADPLDGFAPTGDPLSGGDAEPDPTDEKFELAAPNLTPDPEQGHIAKWDETMFVNRFRGGVAFAGSKMPWENFAELTDDDVRSLYRYLQSVKPSKHPNGPPRRPAGWKP
jgi:mono/diheme cytochrome c family protein